MLGKAAAERAARARVLEEIAIAQTQLLRAIPKSDEPALRAKLRELVPTFHAPDGQTLPQNAAVG